MPGGIRITLHGDEELIARLSKIGPRARGLFKEALQDSVDHVRNRAVEGIANGPKTGRVYTMRYLTNTATGGIFPSEARTPHQASAPGEYPAADTGNLMRSIYAEVEDRLAGVSENLETELSFSFGDLLAAENIIEGWVGADSEYAVHLEYKAPTEGGRPFLRRSLAESEDFVRQRFRELRGRIFDQ